MYIIVYYVILETYDLDNIQIPNGNNNDLKKNSMTDEFDDD